MTIATGTLVKVAAIGGFIVSTTGFYLQFKLVDRVRAAPFYKDALKQLRANAGAVHYLGQPIKDRRFKISDPDLNYTNTEEGKFCIPVTGPKDKGTYYIFLKNVDGTFQLTQAELELKSRPEERLVILKNSLESEVESTMNKFVGTAREKFNYYNTLLCLVKAMEGKNIAVDLRNDSYVCGTVSVVDGYMNISLINAVYCDNLGKEHAFENLYVHARNIRYVHIPENISILAAIKGEFEYKKPAATPKVKSRKAKKALQRHMDTVALLMTDNDK